MTLGKSVTSIGNSAFAYCYRLRAITIPDAVTSIGNSAFYDDYRLTSVTFGKGVVSIGSSAFSDCSALTSIALSEALTTIGSGAFSKCTSLSSIQFNNSLMTIGSSAFRYCSALPSVSLPDSLQTIGSWAFADTTFTSVTIPKNVTSIGGAAFYSSSLTEIIVAAGNSKFKVAEDGSLYQMKDGEYDSLIVCLNPAGLTEVKVQAGTKAIGDYVFYEYTKLSKVELPESLTSIGASAFRGCTGLSKVELPDSLTSIGNQAFYKCIGLSEMKFSSKLTSIGTSAFYECTGLSKVELSESLTSIGASAFRGCTGLLELKLPDKLESIGNFAFYDCTDLKTVSLGVGFKTLGTNTFGNCSNLAEITCSEKNAYFDVIDNALYSKNHTIFYLYPAGRTDTAFYMDDAVTTVASYSIASANNLKDLYIPKNVTELQRAAIRNNNLSSICFYGNAPKKYTNSIYGQSDSLVIYYIEGMTGFAEADWKKFTIMTWDPMLNFADEGTIGDTITWEFVGKLGRLTLEGTGELPDYSEKEGAPWSSYMEYIKVVETGKLSGIGDYAFYQAEKLQKLTNKGELTRIGASAFKDCKELTYVDLENAVSIGASAFENCAALTAPVLSSKLTGLADNVFSGCSSITALVLPETLTSIGDGALKGCTAIRTINIPAAVTSIGEKAFAENSGLEKVYFYGSVPQTWAEDSFADCGEGLCLYYRSSDSKWAEFEGLRNEVTVKKQDKFYTEQKDHYSFANRASSFGYRADYRIARQRYVDVLGDVVKGTYYYSINNGWYGSCYGMSSTTLKFYEDVENSYLWLYDENAQSLYDIASPNTELTKLIEAYQISQYKWVVQLDILKNYNKCQSLLWKIEEFERSGGLAVDSQAEPVVLAIYNKYSGHAVVPVSATQNTDGDYEIQIYDPNYPNALQTITVKKDFSSMSYAHFNIRSFSFITYDTIVSSMEEVSLHSEEDTTLYVAIDKENGSITNSDGKGIDEIEGAYEQKVFSDNMEEEFSGVRSFVLPEGNYAIAAEETQSEAGTSVQSETENEDVTFYMAAGDVFAEITSTDETAALEIKQTGTEDGAIELAVATEDSVEGTTEESTSITLVNSQGVERVIEVESNTATVSIAKAENTEEETIAVKVPEDVVVTVDGNEVTIQEDGTADITFAAKADEKYVKVKDVTAEISCNSTNQLSGKASFEVKVNEVFGGEATAVITFLDENKNKIAAYEEKITVNKDILNDITLEFENLKTTFASDALTEKVTCQVTVSDVDNSISSSAKKDYTVKKYAEVQFDTDGGTGTFATQYVAAGGTIQEPETKPAKEHYTFKYWSLDGKEAYDFGQEVSEVQMKLTAVWEAVNYTVTFDSDGGTRVNAQIVAYGKKAVTPEAPGKTGYRFLGWYEGESKTAFNFATAITQNITLKAKWEKESEPHTHNYNQSVATDRYLKSAATCKEAAVYYKSCTCGEKGTATFTYGTVKSHSYQTTRVTKATLKDNGTIIETCSNCKETKKTTIYRIKTVKLSKTGYTYNSKKKQGPTLIIKDSKGNTIDKKNYTVKGLTKKKNVGTYTVKVTFKGNYKGTKTLTFRIVPKSTSIRKVAAEKKGFTVTWKKQTTQISGYQLQYSTTKKFTKSTTKTKIASKSKTSLKVANLKAKKKYYVRIRTYKTVNGKKVYSGWSQVEIVTTKKK